MAVALATEGAIVVGADLNLNGQPEGVSSWFAFLASGRSQHAVGIEINVSGGQIFT